MSAKSTQSSDGYNVNVTEHAVSAMVSHNADAQDTNEDTKHTPLHGSGFDVSCAKFSIGSFVEHREMGVFGVVFDVDARFDQDGEILQKIPQKHRPSIDQPFYHVFINNEQDIPQIAYISEQSLKASPPRKDFVHPGVSTLFNQLQDGSLILRRSAH